MSIKKLTKTYYSDHIRILTTYPLLFPTFLFFSLFPFFSFVCLFLLRLSREYMYLIYCYYNGTGGYNLNFAPFPLGEKKNGKKKGEKGKKRKKEKKKKS